MTLDRTPWTDQTIMPFGTHKGIPLEEVPAGYLDWLMGQTWIKDWPGLYAYIKANLDVIHQQLREEDESLGEVDDDEGFSSWDDYQRYQRRF